MEERLIQNILSTKKEKKNLLFYFLSIIPKKKHIINYDLFIYFPTLILGKLL